MIYAGVDSNGTDYNRNAWVVPGGGGGLVRQPDGSLRVCQLRDGQVTVGVKNPASYSRPHTAATFTVPFEVSGEIALHRRMDDVWIFGENRTPTWTWGVNVHPVFVDEDNNVVTGFAPNGKDRWSASGQIDGKYGIARAETYLSTGFHHDAQFGAWHRFRIVVPAVGVHEVYWDDVLVYRVVEKTPPAAWWNRPLHAGLRLDFYDYSLRNLTGDDDMGQPFDRSRHDWYPTVSHGGVVYEANTVVSSSGSPRPALPIPLDTFTVHYGGAGTWLDTGDTAAELAAIERNWAIPQRKPNEYNSASDSEAITWEYAGRFQAAHSAGENGTAWGHLCVLGLESPTEAQADQLIAGIRKARAQAVAAGYLTPGHRVVPHRHMPGAATPCPGPLYENPMWWARIAAPLIPLPPPPPLPPLPPTTTEVDMIAIDYTNPITKQWTALTYTGSHLAHVSNGNVDAIVRRAGVQRVAVNDVELDGLIASATTTTTAPPEFSSSRKAAWTANRG